MWRRMWRKRKIWSFLIPPSPLLSFSLPPPPLAGLTITLTLEFSAGSLSCYAFLHLINVASFNGQKVKLTK